MKLKPCLLLALFCASTAHAQGTFTFTPSSMGAITSDYYDDHQTFTFPSPSISLANYNSLQVTFSAPSGYAWQVLTGHDFGCAVSYGSADPEADTTVDYSFNFVPGMANVVSGGVTSQRLSEQSCGFAAGFQFGGNVEFTDLTVTLHYVPLHYWQVAQRPLSQFSQAYFDIYKYPGLDRGQHLFLLPIPEPNVAALALLGAGLGILLLPGHAPDASA